jgi:hypothetical protein
MKLRHAAARALVGCWYLMVPTVCPPNNPVPCVSDPGAPLSEWGIGGYFDSAAARGDELNTLKRQAQEHFEPGSPQAVFVDKYQCISEDDPRWARGSRDPCAAHIPSDRR